MHVPHAHDVYTCGASEENEILDTLTRAISRLLLLTVDLSYFIDCTCDNFIVILLSEFLYARYISYRVL